MNEIYLSCTINNFAIKLVFSFLLVLHSFSNTFILNLNYNLFSSFAYQFTYVTYNNVDISIGMYKLYILYYTFHVHNVVTCPFQEIENERKIQFLLLIKL